MEKAPPLLRELSCYSITVFIVNEIFNVVYDRLDRLMTNLIPGGSFMGRNE